MLDPSFLPLVAGATRLRPMTTDDAAAYAAGTEDAAVRRFGHLPNSEYSPESVRAMISDQIEPGLVAGTLAVLTLAHATTDGFVGSVVLFDVSSYSAEVGFWLHPDARGAGHARRGLELATDSARASGLFTLTARTVTDNEASQHCLMGAGFVESGRRPDTAPSGEHVELIHYRRQLGDAPQWPLLTDRLSLRLHREGDEEWMYALYAQPDVARYLLDGPWSRAEAEQKLTERLSRAGLDAESGALALVIERDGAPIGDIALWLIDRQCPQAEIGWVLDPKHGGRGFASEAVRAVLALGFTQYRVHRITARMDSRNAASAKLARRVGMRLEAHHLQDWWSKGEWTDTIVYSALAPDIEDLPTQDHVTQESHPT